MNFNELVILIFLIIISGFFSGSELAYVVSNKIKVEIKARKKNIAAVSALHFINHPQEFFSTILIGNNVVNIAFASISTIFLARELGLNEGSILLISTVVLLIFGELLPKYFAREIADRLILLNSIPLRIISIILYPFVKITSSVSSRLTRATSITEENMNLLFSKEDMESLVKESQEAGVVNKKESDIISRVFELGDQRVYEAMRPRTEIVGVEINQTVNESLEIFIESGYSKLPVFDENLDNIKGVIYTNDFFKFPKDLRSITREVMFVPETKKSFDMLNDFLSKQVSIAVVVDEFGGTAGIVTMEDIIEELFGEIKDEYDIDEEICRKITSGTYLISGKVEIDFINEKYNLQIPYGDYETLGGYITSRLGRIPAQGENLVIDNFNILIVRANQIKIDVVKLIVNSGEEDEDSEEEN
jgi:putative hemolysin